VQDVAQVLMMMSSSRNWKLFQIRVSKW